MCSSAKERGGFKEGQGLLFGQAYPYKKTFIDPVVGIVSQTDRDCSAEQ